MDHSESAKDDSWLDDGPEDFDQDELFAQCDDEVLAGKDVADLGAAHLLDLLLDSLVEHLMDRRTEERSNASPQTSSGPVSWKFVLP
ncbi:hypothetical protein SCLCIDRAFT_1213492 [Scleroderma citrinum Foug A]|uniref:Uncharacterized protein n=1 Tax=Scleroderma citrinum Foug A TaxID=1036808 RepID=A0A0C2ZR98_9AGAM|nr:hypothetical protein SCLCIDRAFT_1213492 [Scleroderma citrinum Foug A]